MILTSNLSMKELALHILDVAKNSISAGAGRVDITLTQTQQGVLTIAISDDGKGMSSEFLAQVTDPFTTTRTTRKVGMGLSLYCLAAEQTGGLVTIESTPDVGTTVIAVFHTGHLDCAPIGDLAGTMAMLIQGSPQVDFTLTRTTPKGNYTFSTREMRDILGHCITLDGAEFFLWIHRYLSELESEI